MNYIEFWIGSWLKKTKGLSLLEKGVYFDLLISYYSEELPLPVDYKELYDLCGCKTKAERVAVVKIADRFFPVQGMYRHNKRADEEIESVFRRSRSSRENGRLGGRPKKTQQVNLGSASGNLDESPTVPIPQSTVNKGKERETRPQSQGQVAVLFQERGYPVAEAAKFWNYYEANGWRVGRNPMKDWKAAAAGWVSRSQDFKPKANGKHESISLDEHRANFEAVEAQHRNNRS